MPRFEPLRKTKKPPTRGGFSYSKLACRLEVDQRAELHVVEVFQRTSVD